MLCVGFLGDDADYRLKVRLFCSPYGLSLRKGPAIVSLRPAKSSFGNHAILFVQVFVPERVHMCVVSTVAVFTLLTTAWQLF